MQHKSVPLPIKSADDQGGTFTGLASVFDNLDHNGDIVRRGAFSKSLGSDTHRYCGLDAQGLMTHAVLSVMSSRPPRPTTVWRSRAGLISTPSFGKPLYRNTKGRKVSGLSIGYAIRNTTETDVKVGVAADWAGSVLMGRAPTGDSVYARYPPL